VHSLCKQTVEQGYKELYKSAQRSRQITTAPCDIPVFKLNLITIRALRPFIGSPASGCVLRVTIIRAPCLQQYVHLHAIQLLVADAENNVLQLSLPHVRHHSTWARDLWSFPDILKTFSADSRIQLKKSYLEIDPSGMPHVRLGHHSSVQFEEPAEDANLKVMEQFGEKGYEYFEKKEVW